MKIYQCSSLPGVSLKHSPHLMEFAAKFGKVQNSVQHENTVIVAYESCIELTPSTKINYTAEETVDSVYAYCYPQIEDILKIEESKGLLFKKTGEVAIPSTLSQFVEHDKIVACKEGDNLLLINMNNNEMKRFNHPNFVLGAYPPYLCVALEYKYIYFYENWSQPYIVKIKLKKLQVKSFCRANNCLFAGGINSKFSFKGISFKREVCVYQNFKVVE